MENNSEMYESKNDLNNSIVRSNYKKKSRKKRFLSNAKGFGKKGIYGRGTHIEENQFTYFVNILSNMKNDPQALEDKVIMANNVLEQTIDNEISLSGNQVVCQVIELLIGFTNANNFERFIQKFSEDLRPLCSNNYASHVLQKLIQIAFLRSVDQLPVKNKTETESDTEPPLKKKFKFSNDQLSEKEYNLSEKFEENHRNNCAKFVLKVGKFLLNNLEDFIWDPYANHVLRTAILSLAGIYCEKVAWKRTNSSEIDTNTRYVVPSEWYDVVKEFVNRLELWPQFPDFSYNELSSALLGCLCTALKVIDKNKLKHFGKQILIKSFLKINKNTEDDKKKIEINDEEDDNGIDNKITLPSVFQSVPAIRLLETLLIVAGVKLFTQLYAMLFSGRIKILAREQKTNFAVQRLIENIKDKCDFESIFTEIIDDTEELLRIGNTGVIYALSSGCLRFQTKQAVYIQALQKAFHLTEASKGNNNLLFLCLIKLKPYEHITNDNDNYDKSKSSLTVHLHGSLIIQNILNFNKPIQLVNCILNTSQTELIEIFSSSNGSFIVNAFVESKFIGEKSREKLLRHLEGSYTELAITKFGSRIIEKLFEYANDGQKLKIAKELSDKCNQLNSTLFGRILFNKLRLQTYRLSSEQWKASFNKTKKIEKLFKNIVN